MIQFNSNNGSEPDTARHNAGQILHDMVTLAELQSQLFASDARESVRRTLRPIAVCAAGLVLLLAAVSLGLEAIAQGLVAAGLTPAAADALVAGASLVVGAAIAFWAWRWLWSLPAGFARSREELVRNMAWIKNAVAPRPRRPSPRREYPVPVAAKREHGEGDSRPPRFH